MYLVRHNDYDPDFVTEKTYETKEEVFCRLAESVLQYLEENLGEYRGTDEEDNIKELWKALQGKDYEKLLGPVNKYLFERGNGEGFEVSKKPKSNQNNVKSWLKRVKDRVDKLSLDKILGEE